MKTPIVHELFSPPNQRRVRLGRGVETGEEINYVSGVISLVSFLGPQSGWIMTET
jgi:hypothetical protein